MGHPSRWIVIVLTCLLAAPLGAEDRLGVLEFFGNVLCPSCQEAGPAISTLQTVFAGRAVLLEYDYNTFHNSGRVMRFWAAEDKPQAAFPFVMVGSGAWTTTGPRTIGIYQNMIEQELARPPEAAVKAYSRRMGDALRIYVRVQYIGRPDLAVDDDPTLWLILWEDRPIGLTRTWVKAAGSKALPPRFGSREPVDLVLDTPPLLDAEWETVRSLALVERGTDDISESGLRRYDALQAAVARPAGLTAAPARLALGAGRPTASLTLEGPHVLAWTATTDAEWLRIDPPSGSLPASPTVSLVPELQPPGRATATVRVEAQGDEMSFTRSVGVSVQSTTPRPAGRRLVPGGSATGG